MFGFLLFSAVVLSAVNCGSLLKLSARIELTIAPAVYKACVYGIHKNCLPSFYGALTVANSSMFLATELREWESGTEADVTHTFTFSNLLKSDIQIPMSLRVIGSLMIHCENTLCPKQTAAASVIQLIKIPTLIGTKQVEAQVPFNQSTFDVGATLFVTFDTSGSKGTECKDHSSEVFCPPNLPYSCPIFSDSMTNPCCPVNVDFNCTMKTESIIDGPGSTPIVPVCRENVYFWVMIEFVLLTAVLLISLIFVVICNPSQKNNFVEEDDPEEEDADEDEAEDEDPQ